MKRPYNIILLSLLTALIPFKASAQLDPTLTGMIIAYTDKAQKQYKSQLGMMALETEGHVWLKSEVEAATNYQKEFDKYLNNFRSILAYAAQTYGFYHEISKLSQNMGKLSQQIGDAPTNAIAVAIHGKRNDIYVDIINKSIGILNTIRQVCIDNKMTEKQRIELVFSIRPQLQQMNHKLATLTKLVRCTTMAQEWYEIEYGSLPHREGKMGILDQCLAQWKINAKSVRTKH